ncbi:hypothetical protein AMELA_G00058760 [Ameiurus melas]|uniref:C-type lectin domain-containing protein n=1 Tax=Ameiurus melas TaxID=219545 RepID=A0A7J6B336_AMEME|nr:hypothetical protein AMELA_G00058760 [Ameiurus melas]
MDAVKDLLKEEKDNFWKRTNNGERRVWIGLRQNETYWDIYKNRSWYWSDGAPYNYTYWQYGEPNNNGDVDYCVEVYSGNNTWNDAGCDHLNSFVCYKKRTPLTVITEKKTWREALRYCRQNHVDLVSVDSHEMQEWVGNVTKNVSSDMWIGLRHTCALGFWYWVNGEMICYQNWAPGNGTGVEDCGDVERTGAVLSESKKWVSLPQTQELYFICITFQ